MGEKSTFAALHDFNCDFLCIIIPAMMTFVFNQEIDVIMTLMINKMDYAVVLMKTKMK